MGLIPGLQIVYDYLYQFRAARLRFDMPALAVWLPRGVNRGIRQFAS